MKKYYMLEFIKETSFDKLKNIYEKQKFGKCFQHIKETRKKKKGARWRLACCHPLSLRGRATKQICGHCDGCHADPTATTTPQGRQTNPQPPNRIIMQNHVLATYLALVPIFFIFKTTNILSDTSYHDFLVLFAPTS
jgi:hypothetical protein